MGKDKKPAPVAAVAAGATTAPVAGAEVERKMIYIRKFYLLRCTIFFLY